MPSAKGRRAKGVTFEREVARAFEAAGWRVRGRESGGDHLCVEVERGDIPAPPPRVLHVECKRHERLRIPEWIGQAEGDADGLPWLLVFKQSRREPYVILPLRQYLGGGSSPTGKDGTTNA